MTRSEFAHLLQQSAMSQSEHILDAETEAPARTPNANGLWSKLPNEIALIIWEYAFHAQPPRLVHVALPEDNAEEYNEEVNNLEDLSASARVRPTKKRTWIQASSLVPPSPVTAVCTQSRDVALKAVELEFGKVLSPREPVLWFSPKKDTLYLDKNAVRSLWPKNKETHPFGKILSRVQKLAIYKPLDVGGIKLNEIDPHDSTPWRSGKTWIVTFVHRWFRDVKLVSVIHQAFTAFNVKTLVIIDSWWHDYLLQIVQQRRSTLANVRFAEMLLESAITHLMGDVQEVSEVYLDLQAFSVNREIDNGIYLDMKTITTREKADEINKAVMAFYPEQLRISRLCDSFDMATV